VGITQIERFFSCDSVHLGVLYVHYNAQFKNLMCVFYSVPFKYSLSLLLYSHYINPLTLSLLMYIYGLTFGNSESRLFLFAAHCFNIESMQKVFLCFSRV
jgi:hypothetical protein